MEFPDRQIRIFISSTFRDMQEERDALLKVIHEFQNAAAARDVTVVPVDLRWGINYRDARGGKVLQVCLEEIKNSRPYFIGLVGNRYGWCPPVSELGKNPILRERYYWLENCLKQGLSVTEIEMRYGVLNASTLRLEEQINEEDLQAFFYIKSKGKTDNENKDKLERLKATLRTNGKHPCTDFSDTIILQTAIRRDLMQMLDKLYPIGQLTDLEKERIAQSAFLRSRCETYIPKEEYFIELDKFLVSSWQQFKVVTGDSGIGKSALLANWIKRHEHDNHQQLIYHFVGNGNQGGDYNNILKRLVEEIYDKYHLGKISNSQKQKPPTKQLESAFKRIADQEPLLIVLDGINQLAQTSKNAKQLDWLPDAPKNVKILFSTLSDDETMKVFKQRNYPILTVLSLSSFDRFKLLNQYLKRYGKNTGISQELEWKITDGFENTLVLRTFLEMLVDFGNFEKLTEFIDYFLKSSNNDDFFLRAIRHYEKTHNSSCVENSLSLIAFSNNGLTENELLSISGIQQIEWSPFFCSFKRHLIAQNGLITFSHQYIRSAVLRYYGDKEVSARNAIISFFKTQRTGRSVKEVAYQYYMLRDYDALYDYLVDFGIFEYFYDYQFHELARYWYTLQYQDEKKYTLKAFLNLPIREENRYADWYMKLALFINRSQLDVDDEISEDLTVAAMIIYEKNKKKNMTPLASCYNSLAVLYGKKRQYDKTLEYYNKALKLDPKNKYYIINIGSYYLDTRDYDNALKYFQRALKMRGINKYEEAVIYRQMGVLFMYKENYIEAQKYLEKAIEHSNEQLLYNVFCIETMGDIYRRQKNHVVAATYYKKAYETIKEQYGEDNHRAKNCLNKYQEAINLITAEEKKKKDDEKEKSERKTANIFAGILLGSILYLILTFIGARSNMVEPHRDYGWGWAIIHGSFSIAHWIYSLFNSQYVCKPDYYGNCYAFFWWLSLIFSIIIYSISIFGISIFITSFFEVSETSSSPNETNTGKT